MKKTIQIPLDIHYHTLGKLTEKTQFVWIACHGYGQLSEFFIKHFECLDQERNFIIAPQGISTFYLKSFTGRVGATWMTNYERETAIDNYLRMLTGIYEKETARHSTPIKTVLFGFSQGAATVGRLATLTKQPFDALVLWGGRFPHDVNGALAKERLADKAFSMYLGTQDKLIDAQKQEEQKKWLDTNGLNPEIVVYEGEHKLYPRPLTELANSLETQLG